MSQPVATAGRMEVAAGVQGLESARLSLIGTLAQMTPRPGRAAVYAVELVLEEYATNARRHGGAEQVHLVAHDRGATIELDFSDDGAAFDPTAASLPAAPADLDAAEPGGLGLVLMAHYASAWFYAREVGLNRLRIVIDKRAD